MQTPSTHASVERYPREEVTGTVRETGLTEAGPIMLHLQGKVKSNCKINNPTGCCCHPMFN